MVDRDQGWLDGRASEWQRFLRWAHASYGWTEEVIVKRAGETIKRRLERESFERGRQELGTGAGG